MDKIDVSYLKWEEFYKTDFCPKFNFYRNNIDKFQENSEDACNELFNSAIRLMQLYLSNNGIFKNDSLSVIRECFYIDFLEDGEAWIDAYYYFSNLDASCSFNKKFFEIFISLNDKFAGII